MNLMKATLAGFIALAGTSALSADYVKSPPLRTVLNSTVKDCRMTGTVRVPFITWGGDIATILGVGGERSLPGSIFKEEGIDVELVRKDVFADQVRDYLDCTSPFLRGTQGQINLAADLAQSDPRTEMIAINQLSWSNGGDYLVVNSRIQDPRDLRGKRIALQAYGPHVDYLARILTDAGIGLNEVTIVWTRDLTGTNSSPAAALRAGDADAAFVVTPDALSLTSGGSIGTGAEDSVQGASVLLSTKTAARVISDVYVVRRDFYEQNQEWVHAFVRAWLMSEEAARESVRDGSMDWSLMARMLLSDASLVEDARGLWADAETSGLRANVNWANISTRRGFTAVNNEIQTAFIGMGLMERAYNIRVASIDYNSFTDYLTDTGGVETARFNAEAVNRVVTTGVATGSIADQTLFEFSINFDPNNDNFTAELYADAFREVIRRASIYSGAVITVEGHSDPLNYLRSEQKGAKPSELRQIRQSALNLSAKRSAAVRDAILEYASQTGESMDPSQFAIVPMGISAPLHNPPKTEAEWRANMRVVFRILQVEAEASVFTPLN